jgi:DNA-binding MurR/RpiR family transcriptional regulator
MSGASDRDVLPQDMDELLARITSQQDQLSARLKQVAGWLLEHPQQVAFSTLAEIAEAAGVHPSTLIRFANFFGFSGFSELQRIYKNQIINHPNNYQERIRQLRQNNSTTPETSAGSLLTEFTEGNLLALELLRAQANPQQLEAAVETLYQSRQICICGVRRAYPVAAYLNYTMSQLGIRCMMIDGMAGMQEGQSLWLDADTTLIAVTFNPYTEIPRNAVAKAKERGSQVILITDSELCPLAPQADHVFTVRESEVRAFRSLTSTLCLAQTLCVALGYRCQEESE